MIEAAVVFFRGPECARDLAGLPVVRRMVLALRKARVGHVFVVFPGAGDESVLPGAGEIVLENGALPDVPCLEGRHLIVFGGPVVLDPEAVSSLHATPAAPESPLALTGSSGAVGAFLLRAPEKRAADRFLAAVARDGASAARSAPRRPVSTGVFVPLGEAGSAKAGERALLRSLRRETDGFFAYYFDRKISAAISRWLVRTPISPNQISLLTLLPAVAGAILVAFPDPVWAAAGAALFCFSTIVDGCDGEVARLKYMQSEAGAKLDLFCDNIALGALFAGIVVHVYHEAPGQSLVFAGAAIAAGVLIAVLTEYVAVLRPRIHGNTTDAARRSRIYERLASRDFAYLLPFLAYFGLLRWFVFATAVGVNLFWMALLCLVVRPWEARA